MIQAASASAGCGGDAARATEAAAAQLFAGRMKAAANEAQNAPSPTQRAAAVARIGAAHGGFGLLVRATLQQQSHTLQHAFIRGDVQRRGFRVLLRTVNNAALSAARTCTRRATPSQAQLFSARKLSAACSRVASRVRVMPRHFFSDQSTKHQTCQAPL